MLIVEDGTGLSNANSYASLEEADTYHSLRGNSLWTGEDSVKEAALIRATSSIDGMYARYWPGTRATKEQALDWPRVDAYDRDGYLETGLPRQVVNATIEAALIELQTPGTLTSELDRGGAIKREKVGPIETEYMDSSNSRTKYPAIENYLFRFIKSYVSVRRG